jgi:hypothetical protein
VLKFLEWVVEEKAARSESRRPVQPMWMRFADERTERHQEPDPALRGRPITGMPLLLDTKRSAAQWGSNICNARGGGTYAAHSVMLDANALRVKAAPWVPCCATVRIENAWTDPDATCIFAKGQRSLKGPRGGRRAAYHLRENRTATGRAQPRPNISSRDEAAAGTRQALGRRRHCPRPITAAAQWICVNRRQERLRPNQHRPPHRR